MCIYDVKQELINLLVISATKERRLIAKLALSIGTCSKVVDFIFHTITILFQI